MKKKLDKIVTPEFLFKKWVDYLDANIIELPDGRQVVSVELLTKFIKLVYVTFVGPLNELFLKSLDEDK